MTESLAPTCNRDGCDRRPSHYLMVCIPAIGGPLQRHMRATLAMALCRDHAQATKLEDVFDEDGRASVSEMTLAMGYALPDFGRAWVETHRMGDENWNDFMADMARGRGGGRA